MGIEIEKKFIVNTLPADLPPGVDICQGYLLNTPEKIVRVRIQGDKGFLTVKGRPVALVRPEYEYEIPVTDTRQMLDRFCDGKIIEKCRHTCFYQGMTWVIDRFSGANQGLVVAEIELTAPDQLFSIPPWAGPEVTDDPRYLNASLIHHPYTLWQKETPPEDRIHLTHYLNQHAQILFLILDNTGIVLHANRFAEHCIKRPVLGKPFQELIRDFHQTLQPDQAAACPDTVHLLDFDTPSGLPQTYRFHFYASAGRILALGHLDVEEIATLSDELVALNQELNNLTRELNVKNRELTKAGKKILELTRIDPLTGLANRRFFSERIQEMISLANRRSQPLSLIMTDIDHFKRVNDTWGHDAGDRVLKAYATLMKTRTRAEDLVARFGGEEFIILMPLADVHEAFAYAERIRCAIAKADLLESGDSVTASFGVAGLFFDETGDDIIKRADTALYQAKASGRNRIVIAPDPL